MSQVISEYKNLFVHTYNVDMHFTKGNRVHWKSIDYLKMIMIFSLITKLIIMFKAIE